MTQFFDPKTLQDLCVPNIRDLTAEQRADKLIYHIEPIKGVDFVVYSKYDKQGDLFQRVMMRKAEVDAQIAEAERYPYNQTVKF